DCQPFERLEINFGRVQPAPFVWPMRAFDELPARAAAHIRFENFIRVVQIRHHQIEFGKIIREVLGEFAAPGEKARQCSRLDRLGAIHQPAGYCKLDDMWVAEHFQVRFRKLPPQGSYGRQRQDKISNRPAAYDQNFAAERTHANFVSPSTATSKPNARRIPHPTFTRFSLAVPHCSKSRSRQGDTVNQMPPTTST